MKTLLDAVNDNQIKMRLQSPRRNRYARYSSDSILLNFKILLALSSMIVATIADVGENRQFINVKNNLASSACNIRKNSVTQIRNAVSKLPLKNIPIGRSKVTLASAVTSAPEAYAENEITSNDVLDEEFEDNQSEEEHPLRMALWKVNLRHGMTRSAEPVQFYFNRDGKVILRDGSGTTGEWWFDQGGISWDIDRADGLRKTIFHYHADIHLNKFGERPRMYKGVVTRDRYENSFLPSNLFRPVVGTFSAQGVGKDTRDTTYKNRLLGDGFNNYSISPRTSSYEHDEDW